MLIYYWAQEESEWQRNTSMGEKKNTGEVVDKKRRKRSRSRGVVGFM